jgi:hypothetical protein
MQQYIKLSAVQVMPQFTYRFPPGPFVEDNEFNPLQVAEQAMFHQTDNPTDAGVRPLLAQRVNNRQDMRDVAQS